PRRSSDLDRAVRGRDPGDPVLVPDVGPDFAVDVLELVQAGDGLAAVAHGDLAHDREAVRIEKLQRRRAVAHDQELAVVREAPALSAVREGLDHVERLDVVDDADLILPGELIEPIAEDRDALAEEIAREAPLLLDPAGLEIHPAHGRCAVLP